MKQKKWQTMKDELRDEFEDLFPKDKEAIYGIRPSKSNRTSALVLWAKFELIIKQAIEDTKNKIKI